MQLKMGRVRTVFLQAGQQFGRLTVIDPDAGRTGKSRTRPKGMVSALVQCKCGTVKLVAVGNLRAGGTVSCGCARRNWFADSRLVNTAWRPRSLLPGREHVSDPHL